MLSSKFSQRRAPLALGRCRSQSTTAVVFPEPPGPRTITIGAELAAVRASLTRPRLQWVVGRRGSRLDDGMADERAFRARTRRAEVLNRRHGVRRRRSGTFPRPVILPNPALDPGSPHRRAVEPRSESW